MRKHVNKLEMFADDIDVSNPVWSSMPSFPFLRWKNCRNMENKLIQMWFGYICVRWDHLGDNWISGESLRLMPCTLWYLELISWVVFLMKSNKAMWQYLNIFQIHQSHEITYVTYVSLCRWFDPVGTHFHHDRGSVATSTKGKSLGGPATFWHKRWCSVFFRGVSEASKAVKFIELRYHPFCVESPAPPTSATGRDTKIICVDLDTFKAVLHCSIVVFQCSMYEDRLYPFCIAWFLLCFDLFRSKCRTKASDFSEFGSHSSMQAGQILGNAGYTPVLMNFANESFGKMGVGCLFFALAVRLAWTTAYTTLHRSSQGMFKKCPKYAHIPVMEHLCVFILHVSKKRNQRMSISKHSKGVMLGAVGSRACGVLKKRGSCVVALSTFRCGPYDGLVMSFGDAHHPTEAECFIEKTVSDDSKIQMKVDNDFFRDLQSPHLPYWNHRSGCWSPH